MMSAWRASKRAAPVPAGGIRPGAVAVSGLAAQALHTGRCLSFVYQGRQRLVEVHSVGVNAADALMMAAYQVGGESKSGMLPDWRSFFLDQCEDVRVTGTPSQAPRPYFARNDRRFATVIVEL